MAYKSVYDLNKVSVNIGVGQDVFPIDGLMSIEAELSEDTYTLHVASNGEARQVRNNNNSGEVRLSVANWAKCNLKIMLLNKSGLQFPIAVIDKSSTARVVFADGCMLKKVPPWKAEKEEGETQYIFSAAKMEILHAGAKDE